MLGTAPGVYSCGELDRLWLVLDLPDRRCSCGKHPRACEFWVAVMEKGFGKVSTELAAHFEALHSRLAPIRRIYRFLPSAKSAEFLRDLREYQDMIGRLYSALFSLSGARTLIDSSKGAGYGWCVTSLPEVSMRCLHMVRDSRAVAFSWTRTQVSSVPVSMKERRPAMRSAVLWSAENAAAETLRFRARRYVRQRYEDFARTPQQALDSISTRLALPPISLSKAGAAHLDTGHMVTGNPLIYQAGEVTIHEDKEWATAIHPNDARTVTAITWPLLLRYGYSLAQPSRD